jgi:hypothetical protein
MMSLLISAVVQAGPTGLSPRQLWEVWPLARFVETPAPCLRPAELVESLRALEARHTGRLRLEEIGRSFEGRPIQMVTVGSGERRVLFWSQMHGDEPSATPALLDLVHLLLSRSEEPFARRILDELTLLVVPMLNPDGAEVYQRRNAQGIDINRDALNLATPEGRTLERVRDEHEPFLAFSMHDQDRRVTVGDSGVLATNAVLAVAGDEENTLTPGRLRAMRACAAIAEVLAPFIPGGIARYDDDWNPRAFGDNVTAWGTPVVTHESGGLPPGSDPVELTRLSFVALFTVLQELVKNDLEDFDPEVYRALPRTKRDAWSDVVVRGGRLLQPGSDLAYRADLAFDLPRGDRSAAGCERPSAPPGSTIAEVGDARFLGAGRDVEGSGRLLLAPFRVGVDGFRARRWLDGATLDRLARLGVAAVEWRVAPRRTGSARRRARELAAAGRPRLEVVDEGGGGPPGLVLAGPPPAPQSAALGHVVAALARATERHGLESGVRALLERLWQVDPERRASVPALRPGQTASFLVVGALEGGEAELEEAALETVWIDGVELVR